MNTLIVRLGADSYDVFVGRGLLDRAPEFFDLDRRVLVVTDDGVPDRYAKAVQNECKNGILHTVKQGEESKSLAELENILKHYKY